MVTRKIELTEEQDQTLEPLASSQGRSVSGYSGGVVSSHAEPWRPLAPQ
jgi:hypothetical protein